MNRTTLTTLNEARRAGRAIVRAVDLTSGNDVLIEPGKDASALGVAAAAAARSDLSMPVEMGGKTWFLAVYNPPLDLAIVGAVHVAQPLSVMAQLAGYCVRVIDPRAAFATRGHAEA